MGVETTLAIGGLFVMMSLVMSIKGLLLMLLFSLLSTYMPLRLGSSGREEKTGVAEAWG
jgi:hypothetical protein